jgi:hypothetical protein
MEIAGAPDIRHGEHIDSFRPFPPARAAAPTIDRTPTLAADERYLVLLFLRRYVRYCARRGRYAM